MRIRISCTETATFLFNESSSPENGDVSSSELSVREKQMGFPMEKMCTVRLTA